MKAGLNPKMSKREKTKSAHARGQGLVFLKKIAVRPHHSSHGRSFSVLQPLLLFSFFSPTGGVALPKTVHSGEPGRALPPPQSLEESAKRPWLGRRRRGRYRRGVVCPGILPESRLCSPGPPAPAFTMQPTSGKSGTLFRTMSSAEFCGEDSKDVNVYSWKSKLTFSCPEGSDNFKHFKMKLIFFYCNWSKWFQV